MDFESEIRQHVLLGRTSSKGWAPVLCRVCNDHGKKGVRSGFKFEHDGFGYNCFNCEAAGRFSVMSTESPSEELKTILTAFGIPEDFIHKLEMLALTNRTDGNVSRQILEQAKIASGPKVLTMPEYFSPLKDEPEDSPIRILATLHLEQDRAMVPDDFPFYIGKRTDDPDSAKWTNRLILPIYNHNNQLIFWQGRDLTGKKSKKYLSVDEPRDSIMYGMHEVYRHTNAPLFVTEGIFDAWHVQGCATLGRQLTPAIINILNSSTREKVVIPDRMGDGQDLAMQAIRLGWKISTPDLGQCKDVTEAVVRYGKLYVVKNIMENIYGGVTAETMLGLYCK